MSKYKKVLEMSILKTIRFNIHYFGLKGLKFPCIVSKSTKLEFLGGKVKLKNYKFCGVVIGFGPIQAAYDKGRWYNTGTVVFDGEAHLYRGFYIYNNGNINIGQNAKLGASKYFCEKRISIGSDTMISWDCTIIDSDLHKICDAKGNRLNNDKDIKIGNHVWIGYGSSILKGVTIGNNNIVASNSLISNKKLEDTNTMYSSNGRIIKKNIRWFWENK